MSRLRLELTLLSKAIARAWAQAGAAGIVLVGRTTATLDLTVDNVLEIDASIPVVAERADVADESGVRALFARVKSKFGKAHVLINNAATMVPGLIGDVPIAKQWSDYVSDSQKKIHTKEKGYTEHTRCASDGFERIGDKCQRPTHYDAVFHPELRSRGNHYQPRQPCRRSSRPWQLLLFFQQTRLDQHRPGFEPRYIHQSPLHFILDNRLTKSDPEYPNIRVFSVHPGIVAADDRGAVVDAFTPFAKDKQALTGGFLLWLDTPRATFARGGYLSVNWDVEEMEAHADEIREGKLNQLGFLNAKLGLEGHPWISA